MAEVTYIECDNPQCQSSVRAGFEFGWIGCYNMIERPYSGPEVPQIDRIVPGIVQIYCAPSCAEADQRRRIEASHQRFEHPQGPGSVHMVLGSPRPSENLTERWR